MNRCDPWSIRIAIGCKSACEAGLQPVPALNAGLMGCGQRKSSQKPDTLSGIHR